MQEDEHFLTLCRYVERNALRARLVDRAEQWRWSSLWHWRQQTPAPWLADWPLPRPERWLDYVHQPQTEAELAAVRHCVQRGAPFGDERWQAKTAQALHLESSLRSPGRPRKPKNET